MVSAREFINNRAAQFQILRQHCLKWFFYPSISLIIVAAIALAAFNAKSVAIPCILISIALLIIGQLRYRCPACKKTPIRDSAEEGGIDFDPKTCPNCGVALKARQCT